MLCEICGKKEATVYLTQVLNGDVKKIHLCEHCAAASGLDVNNPSITDVLLGLGAPKETAPEKNGKTCPQCHMRFTDFKKTSRLGCQECYSAFAEELAPLLEAMHKGQQHVGKTPAKVRPAKPRPAPLPDLQKALAAAVTAENYEEAARLRDQIRQTGEKSHPA